jgi:hypothetical protein
MHQDPVAKSKRVTDASGNVISAIELDPWGYKFGDKAGVGEKKDRDTGANFQKCVYPSSIKF